MAPVPDARSASEVFSHEEQMWLRLRGSPPGGAEGDLPAAGLDEMVRAERAKNYKGDSAHHNEEDTESRPSATEGHHVMSHAPPPDCGDA